MPVKIKTASFKILVIDDERKALDLIARLVALVIPCSTVEKADHPLTALSMIKNDSYNIILTDINMPQMNGLELIAEIKHTEQKPYCVLVSAYEEFQYAQAAIHLGVADYIIKPLIAEKIETMYRRFLSKCGENAGGKEIAYMKGNEIRTVKISDILAVEKADKYHVNIWAKAGYVVHIRNFLKEFDCLLPESFMYINRQCIVNCNEIKRFSYDTNEAVLVQNGKEIMFPASRTGGKSITSLFNRTKV